MMRGLILCLAFLVASPCVAQEGITVDLSNGQAQEMKVPVADKFQRSLAKAIRSKRARGEMSAAQAVRLRVALISPSFRKRAEDLAVTQMVFSADGPVPRSEDGKVDRSRIDWDSLIGFLERLLPLLLQLLDMFSAADGTFAGDIA